VVRIITGVMRNDCCNLRKRAPGVVVSVDRSIPGGMGKRRVVAWGARALPPPLRTGAGRQTGKMVNKYAAHSLHKAECGYD